MKERNKSRPCSTAASRRNLGFRFAAIAVVFRVMRTDVVAIEMHTRLGEVLVEMRVDGLHGFPCEIPTPDAGLVGDHKQPIARILQLLEGRVSTRDQDDARDITDVVGILHDRAVPVEEDGAAAGIGAHCGRSLPESALAAKYVVSQPVR